MRQQREITASHSRRLQHGRAPGYGCQLDLPILRHRGLMRQGLPSGRDRRRATRRCGRRRDLPNHHGREAATAADARVNTTTPLTTSPDRLPGMLITIDGPGGVGKSTTSQLDDLFQGVEVWRVVIG